MSAKWRVLYYSDSDGNSPVQEFIDSRSAREQAKIMAFLGLLEERGPNLPRPFADLLEDGIHELRIKLSGEQIRVLYFFVVHKNIVLSHAFRKNVSRVPVAELRKARANRQDFLKRNAAKLKEAPP